MKTSEIGQRSSPSRHSKHWYSTNVKSHFSAIPTKPPRGAMRFERVLSNQGHIPGFMESEQIRYLAGIFVKVQVKSFAALSAERGTQIVTFLNLENQDSLHEL